MAENRGDGWAIAGAIAAGAALAYIWRRVIKGPTGPRKRAVIVPLINNNADRIRTLATLLETAWPEVSGTFSGIPQAALELALAQAGAEGTGYGQGWDGDMRGSWNIGSYQCSRGSSGGATYRCVEHKDSRPNKDGTQTEYTTGFRYYQDAEGRSAAENGARDFLRSITVGSFGALPELVSGSVLDYAARIGFLGYYEGFNPEHPMGGGIKDWRERWATTIGYLMDRYPSELQARAAKVHATPEQVAGRIALYAKSMGRRLAEIAGALGQASPSAYLPEDLAT